MARVTITEALKADVMKKFKAESKKIFSLMKSLEEQPRKGTTVGNVGGIVIKEIKYGKFRFYFITDGHVLKFGSADELATLLVKFVRMSGKKDQQEAIDEVRDILASLGFEGF